MISWKQAFVLVFLGCMMVALTYIPTNESGSKNADKIISISIMMIIAVIAFLPMYFLTKRNEGCNLIDCFSKNVPAMTKPAAVVYMLAFSYAIAVTVSRFSLFITSVLLIESKSIVFILIIIAAACYAAYLGIEAVARTSIFVFGVLIVSMAIVGLMQIDEVNVINLRPFFYDGVGPVFSGALNDASKVIEIAALGMIANKVVGGIKKSIITFVITFWIVVSLLTFFMASILGEYSTVQTFPIYTMISLAKVGTFRRFDAILTGVWIVGDFIKVAFLIIVLSDCMKYVFKGKAFKAAISIDIALIFAAAVFASSSIKRYFSFSNYLAIGITAGCVNFLIPLVFLIIDIIKKRKAARTV